MDQIWLKDEGKNPTGSVEDRATAIAVARAREDTYAMLTCGATGNATLSTAALAASVGLRTMLFVSESAPEGFVAQVMLLDAEVFVVEGSYEDAVRMSLQCAEEYGWYNRNKAVNPFLVEGVKTAAYEIAEQMNWAVPDCVIVPIGEGSTIAGIWKGYKEMFHLHWIKELPRMIGVQAQGASPVYTAWKEGHDPTAVQPSTLAESLAVGAPRDWRKAVAAVQESGGLMVAVSDREILQAMHLLGGRSGVTADPGAAATLAGLTSLLRDRQLTRSMSAVLVLASGGLRHASAAVEATSAARRVPPNFNQLRAILQRSLSRTPF
jgi:threonine synthase